MWVAFSFRLRTEYLNKIFDVETDLLGKGQKKPPILYRLCSMHIYHVPVQ